MPQRAIVDAFCAEARPHALRQARRTYSHLPAELHDEAVDQALLELRTGTHTRVDRRALHAALATALDGSLRRIHTAWCLSEARATWGDRTETGGAGVRTGRAAPAIADFVEDGLGGIERAVLQLEIGAGRDTATGRAALRLGPAQYRRYREQGLSKLRSAITAQVHGRVCDEHEELVMLAATGDRTAAAHLAAGPSRCRACSREASAVRRVLTDRLALAPWPLLIKPAGIVAAKLGALGALAGGKAGGASAITAPSLGGAGATAGAAKGVAVVLAAAAITSGGVLAIDAEPGRSPAPAIAGAAQTAAGAGAPSAGAPSIANRPAAGRSERRPVERRQRAERRRAGKDGKRDAPTAAGAPATPATAATAPEAPTTAGSGRTPVQQVTNDLRNSVHRTVGEVTKTVDQVKRKLPVKPAPLAPTGMPDVGGTVDDLTGTVGGLSKP